MPVAKDASSVSIDIANPPGLPILPRQFYYVIPLAAVSLADSLADRYHVRAATDPATADRKYTRCAFRAKRIGALRARTERRRIRCVHTAPSPNFPSGSHTSRRATVTPTAPIHPRTFTTKSDDAPTR